MIDSRITKLAELLVTHSCDLKDSDTVLIHAFDIPFDAVAEVVRVASKTGSKVITRLESAIVRRELMLQMSTDNARKIAEIEKFEMEQVTAYIALRGGDNIAELSDIPGPTMQMWQKEYSQPVVFGVRVPKTKWVVLRWPSPGMAQLANQSTAAFEKFYFDVCTVDYAKMAKAAEPLADLMDRTDQVHIIGPGTDLQFSIKGIGAVACSGARNIPDGECFSAPVVDSMNGVVTYNTATVYQGVNFENIQFTVQKGKIIEAKAGSQTKRLNEILDSDEGARYFGEWSLGYNPHVLHPMKDTLFDEKIAGSFHLTPGNAYDPPGGNGNKSGVHWDIVCIQRPDYGGGEIYFDGKLIRKDGLFTLPHLQGLNPDQLA